eukprot:gnl/MRDRNA2_/MRDRNA2_128353_c0_seq1.p1 gnl/MRDRNA2_/MRDRNA2_128353_c0~~gnl/MRDRNA2_/MRDRNA2_128353_c0_seq1.p1  ORF type:complete len:267 (+),score=34.27 gnl/MRDRNA2_/MRDRNA2_128353_c0_seq1:28-828(+)
MQIVRLEGPKGIGAMSPQHKRRASVSSPKSKAIDEPISPQRKRRASIASPKSKASSSNEVLAMPSPRSKAPGSNENCPPHAPWKSTGKSSTVLPRNPESHVQKLVEVFEPTKKRDHDVAFGDSNGRFSQDECAMNPAAKKLRQSIAAVIEQNASSSAALSASTTSMGAGNALGLRNLLKRCGRAITATRGSLQRVLQRHQMWPQWLLGSDSTKQTAASEPVICANGPYCLADSGRGMQHSKSTKCTSELCQACALWSLVREVGRVV